MKKYILYLAMACMVIAVPIIETGCSTAPDQRTQSVQTLKIVGQTAKTAMDGATQLLKQGSITVEKWQVIAGYYDKTFQPAYALAVTAAQSDLSSVASPDLINLATQFTVLVSQLTTHN